MLCRADADLPAKLAGISPQEWSQDVGEHSVALGPSSAKTGYTRHWRRLNPEAVARHNAARRQELVRVVCVICGEIFVRRSRDRRQVCSPVCARARRRKREKAAA